jgi:pSer/pThr/pTyr-binding forkhead associated (FHA) protein
MDMKLIVLGGKNAGKKIRVTGPKFFIGRAEDCQLRPRSDLISRHHCAIMVEEGYVALRDFGSKNGTYVNGKKVAGEQELKSGDKLEVGQLAFEVSLEVVLGGHKKPKVRSVGEAAARTVDSAAGEDDLDVAGWLQEEEEDKADTQTIDLEQLGQAVSTETQAADSAAETTQEGSSEEEGEEEEGGPKVVGVWAKSKKKITAASTREAAADVLKNFFRRY